MGRRLDVVIVGGGIIGLATAYQILTDNPRRRLVVLEKEPRVGLHQSSHNSGVLHAGLYYAPGSLKARLCTRGRHRMEDFAAAHGIPVLRRGKVVVAVEEVWNKFLLSPIEFARYVDEFDSPRLKAYFDVGNVVLYAFPQDWIRTLGPRIVKVHLKDFNVGQHVEGYSNFLWMALLAAARRLLRVDPVGSAVAMGILASLGTLVMVYLLVTRVTSERGAGVLAAILLSGAGPVAAYAGSGLETALASLLAVTVLYAMVRGWSLAAGLGMAASIMTRPDAAVLVGVALLWLVLRRDVAAPERRRQLAGCLAPLVLIGTERTDTPAHFPDGVTVARNAPHAQVMAAWAHCTMGVVPSIWSEPQALVTFEAMACGAFLLCSPWRDDEGLFRAQQDYVSVGDGAAMQATLREMSRDERARAQIANNGFETISQRHTCAHRAAEFIEICKELGA